MGLSILLFLLAVPLAIGATLLGWLAADFRFGALVGLSVYAFFTLLAVFRLFRLRTVTAFEITLPFAVSVLWSLMLTPLELGANLFTAPAAIGSGALLSLSLWHCRRRGMRNKRWLIGPALVFVYEMLPVNIPGPVDDYLSFGGDAVLLALQMLLPPKPYDDALAPGAVDPAEGGPPKA